MGLTVFRSFLGGAQTRNSYWCERRERRTFAYTQKRKTRKMHNTIDSNEDLTDLIKLSLVKKNGVGKQKTI